MLAMILTVISLIFISPIMLHHYRLPAATRSDTQHLGFVPSVKLPLAMSCLCLLLSGLMYSQLGRFQDWDQGVINAQLDYLVAAEITEARQNALKNPSDFLTQLTLAEAYSAGGMYREAVTTLEQLRSLQPQNAELLGLLATAMYYRDAKLMTVATQEVIAQALALYPYEKNTRLLLATEAYFKGDYPQAIEQWQQVFKNDRQVIDTQAIERAITNATYKMNTALPNQ